MEGISVGTNIPRMGIEATSNWSFVNVVQVPADELLKRKRRS